MSLFLFHRVYEASCRLSRLKKTRVFRNRGYFGLLISVIANYYIIYTKESEHSISAIPGHGIHILRCDQVIAMDSWSIVKNLGVYLGLGIDDRIASRLASSPGNERFLQLIKATAYDVFGEKYGHDEAGSIVRAIVETDFRSPGDDSPGERRASLSKSVYERSIATTGGPFMEFDIVFQRFYQALYINARGHYIRPGPGKREHQPG